MTRVGKSTSILSFLAGLLVSAWAGSAESGSRAEVLRRYGVDASAPLESRVGPTPASVLAMFDEPGTAAPTPHVLTDAERAQLARAIAALPPLHRRVLADHLRTLSFLDGMPNTALTSIVNPDGEYRLFDVTFRAGVFRQDASEWLTEKERSCFDAAGSPLTVTVDIGTTPALVYALLHEATHVVDASLGITRRPPGGADASESAFVRGVWADDTTPAPAYRNPLLESVRFRHEGRVLPIGDARRVYEALRRTPFASLYGSRNRSDDLAEYVALYTLTQKLGQPYRIVIRSGADTVFAYEPMKSELVLGRAGAMKPYFDTGASR
jgi:hypothetical protein